MITREAGIAARIREIFGDKVTVIVGPQGPSSTAWAKPEIYVQLSRFDDWEGETREGARTARRPLPGEAEGYLEERPGRVVLDVEICAAEYSHVQGIRQTLVAPLMSHLETIEEMIVSTGDGGRTSIVFRDFCPELDHVSIAVYPDDDSVVYSGTIRFNFDGFLHLQVVEEVPANRPTPVRKKGGRKVGKKAGKKAKGTVRKKKI